MIAGGFGQNISVIVRYRGLVPNDQQQEMAYGEPNGHVADDVACSTDLVRG